MKVQPYQYWQNTWHVALSAKPHILLVCNVMSELPVPSSTQTLQPNIPMFREAVMYVLPGLLLEPIYHCLYYFEIIQVSCCLLCRSIHAYTCAGYHVSDGIFRSYFFDH